MLTVKLEESATVRNFRIVQTEDSRQVTRDTMNGPSAIAGLEVH